MFIAARNVRCWVLWSAAGGGQEADSLARFSTCEVVVVVVGPV